MIPISSDILRWIFAQFLSLEDVGNCHTLSKSWLSFFDDNFWKLYIIFNYSSIPEISNSLSMKSKLWRDRLKYILSEESDFCNTNQPSCLPWHRKIFSSDLLYSDDPTGCFVLSKKILTDGIYTEEFEIDAETFKIGIVHGNDLWKNRYYFVGEDKEEDLDSLSYRFYGFTESCNRLLGKRTFDNLNDPKLGCVKINGLITLIIDFKNGKINMIKNGSLINRTSCFDQTYGNPHRIAFLTDSKKFSIKWLSSHHTVSELITSKKIT